MKTIKPLLLISLFAALFSLAACEKDGPAERAGEKIDNAVDGTGDALEDAGDDIEDAVDDATN